MSVQDVGGTQRKVWHTQEFLHLSQQISVQVWLNSFVSKVIMITRSHNRRRRRRRRNNSIIVPPHLLTILLLRLLRHPRMNAEFLGNERRRNVVGGDLVAVAGTRVVIPVGTRVAAGKRGVTGISVILEVLLVKGR
jgi:hypothetical protein